MKPKLGISQVFVLCLVLGAFPRPHLCWCVSGDRLWGRQNRPEVSVSQRPGLHPVLLIHRGLRACGGC